MSAGSNAPQPIRNLPPAVLDAANDFAASVALDRRFNGDIYVGGKCYSTVTAAVRAAFIAGAERALGDGAPDGVQSSAGSHGLVLPACPRCGAGTFEGLERGVWQCRSGACGWRGPKPERRS